MKEAELRALISLIDDPDVEVRNHVLDQLRKLGPKAISALESYWESCFDSDLQHQIENVIHDLQLEDLSSRLCEWKTKRQDDLLEGLSLIALYQYPDLDLQKVRADFEQLYYDVWVAFKPDVFHFDQIRIINHVLFRHHRFSANTRNLHAPENNLLNVVLDTKRGNPISLCALYMLISQRLKLPIYGVNLPNLFILTYKSKQHQFYINVYNKGLIFTKEDIEAYLQKMQIPKEQQHFEPCSNLQIIARILRNLRLAYEKSGSHSKAEEIKNLQNTLDKAS